MVLRYRTAWEHPSYSYARDYRFTISSKKITPTPATVELAKAPEKTEPAHSPVPEVAPSVGGCEQFRGIVSQYDWDVSTVLRIMKAESGCISDRDNAGLNSDGSNDVGLMQINSIHVTSGLISNEGRKDPATNIDVAYQLYRGAGYTFNPWSAYNSGKYLQY